MSDVLKIKVKNIMYLATEFDDNMDLDFFKLISMASICRIFNSNKTCNVVGGIVSLYALMTGTMLNDEAFVNSLQKEGFQLIAHKIRCKSDLLNCIKFVDPEINKKFLLYLNSENFNNDDAPILIRRCSYTFEDRFKSLNFSVGFIIAFTGLCLCLMCKKLTKYNHFAWIRRKWNSFLGIVGLNRQFSEFGPSYHLFPGLKVCRNVYSFFKLHHDFRRRLYLGIMKLSWDIGLWGNMCRTVLRFSKGLEMNHLVLINTYILQDHPELIHVEELKLEFQKLQTAFQVFRNENIPEEQWPYIKIMCQTSNDIWNKDNFPMLSYLAVQIGKRSRTDLDAYHCELSSEMLDAANKIMFEIIDIDSVSQIVLSENASENSNTPPNGRNNEFLELFEISDILEKSLYRISGVHHFKGDDENVNILPNIIPSTDIKYFKISSDIDSNMRNIFCLLNISRIYQNKCLTEVIGGILSLFSAVDPATWSSDDCKLPLKKHGFESREISIESANDFAHQFVFENKELNNLFTEFLGSTLSDFSSHSVVIKNDSVTDNMFRSLFMKTLNLRNIDVFLGLCLLPIFKQLNEDNYASWFKHKYYTFCRLVDENAADIKPPKFSDLPFPPLNACSSIYSFFCSNFELRTVLFLRSFVLVKESNETRMIFIVICQNAKENEMNHIYLINNFLLQENKCLLKMKELKPELTRFMRALEDIQCTMPSANDGWVYIKLIIHPNKVEFLNKNYFPLLLYLAESMRDSKNKTKYVGVTNITKYFKKVEDTAKTFLKFYSEAVEEESNRRKFELDFPNGDILSALDDEQLKKLTINSMLFSSCHDKELAFIPDDKVQEIIGMSIEKVKKEYYLFGVFDDYAIILSRLLRHAAVPHTPSNTSQNKRGIRPDKDGSRISSKKGKRRNNVRRKETPNLLDGIENCFSEVNEDEIEDFLSVHPNELYENEIEENCFGEHLSEFHENEIDNCLFEHLNELDENEIDNCLFEDLYDF